MNSFKVIIDGQEMEIDVEEALALDVKPEQQHRYHVLHKNKAYHIELEEASENLKNVTYLLNGTKYTAAVKDKYDALVDMMGFDTSGQKKINEINAPMPGLILDIMVEVGQTVQKGDSLLILEAMKMENVLKAEGEGVVKQILLSTGAAVEKGQIIIEME